MMMYLERYGKNLSLGIGLIIFGLLEIIFINPYLVEQRKEQQLIVSNSTLALESSNREYEALQGLSTKITNGRQTLLRVDKVVGFKTQGQLQMELSKTLHGMSDVHNVRLKYIKYGKLGSKEVAKGPSLESMEAEFAIEGNYASIRSFMQDLESSPTPIATRDMVLEESPEGARLSGSLAIYRRNESSRKTSS